MASLYEEFGTENNLEQEGVVQEYGEFWIKLARAGGSNKAYGKTLDKKSAKYRRAIDIGKLPDDVAVRILVETYAESVVKGWGGDGMVERDGTPIPCTKENVIRVFTDLPDLFAAVCKDSQSIELYKSEQQKVDSGN